MFGFFAYIAASKLCTLKVKTHKTSMPYIYVSADDNDYFCKVYENIAEQLGVPASSLKITMGNIVINKHLRLCQYQIRDNAILRVSYHKDQMGSSKRLIRYRPNAFHKKPVIYLYPTEEIDAKVSVKSHGKFTAVYPAFTDEKSSEWSVHAYPSGKLNVNGREYTSLFWEVQNEDFVPKFETGFIVTKENAISFLEEKLRLIGLTDLEANEFITFWVPVLNKNGKSVVSFQFENYEESAPLLVSPTPDTIIRVYLAIRKAEDNETIEEQKLPTYERHGFTVVEWGGTDI